MADWMINLIPFASDNYAYLIESDDALAVVDPGEAAPVQAAIEALGKPLRQILLTHHHGDHVGGVAALKAQHDARVIGPKASASRLPLDQAVSHGDRFDCLGAELEVIETPGHTLDHVSFYSAGHSGLFCADCLFVLGCGRVFEGDAAMMWASLSKLRALPNDTLVFCGHEYTMANARFALAQTPDDTALQQHIDGLKARRDQGQPTVPSLLEDEKRFNPFLRCDDPAFQAALGLSGMEAAAVFAEVRARKDSF